MIHQWPDEGRAAGAAAPVRLSRAQWLDLAGMLAAAAVSSAIIVAAMLSDSALPPVAPLARGAVHSPVLIAASYIDAPISTPPLRSTRAPRRAAALAPVALPARTVLAEARVAQDGGRSKEMPVSRKLTRIFTGDGRYSVRPFPTVGDEQR
jgi:hypothetical protein